MAKKSIRLAEYLCICTVILLFCANPQNPFNDSANAKISLLFQDSKGKIATDFAVSDTVGNTVRIGVCPFLYKYIDSVVVTILKSQNNIDSVYTLKNFSSNTDTVWNSFTFIRAGRWNISAKAIVQGNSPFMLSGEITIYGKIVTAAILPTTESREVDTIASFSVSATGDAPFAYQWYHDTAALAGETGVTFIKNHVTFSDSGKYTCLVHDKWGDSGVTAIPAILTVTPQYIAPKISLKLSAMTLDKGDSLVLTITVNSNVFPAPLYLWYKADTLLDSTRTNSWKKLNMQATDSGYYYMIVSNAAGSDTSGAHVSVDVPPTITTQPVAQTAIASSSVTFTVVATGIPVPTYQWQKNGKNCTIATATTASLLISAATTSDTGSYSVVVSNPAGNVTSYAVRLTIKTPPSIPVTVFPSNGATGVPISFSLVWSKATLAVHYNVQVASDTAFDSLVTVDSTLTDTTKIVSGLANGTVYYWHVRAINADGASAWSVRHAFYTVRQFSLGFTAMNGTVAKNPNQTQYDSNTVVHLTAMPATGYHFVNWAGDLKSVSATDSLIISAAKNVVANFAINTYQLNVAAGTGGTITAPANVPVSVYYNTETTIAASPATGNSFIKWTVTRGTAQVADTTAASTTVTLTSSDATITAHFEANAFPITTSCGTGGTITPSASVTYGSNTTISISPNPGYDISTVTIDGLSAGAIGSYTFSSVTGPHTISAIFSVHIDTVTFISGANGSLTGTVVQTVIYGGSCTAVTAVPNTGYGFVGWTGGNTTTTNPLTITNVTSNMTIMANFSFHIDTVTFVAGSNGTLTGIVKQTVAYGGNCTAVTAVPNAGYDFSGWTGGYTGETNPLTLSNVTSNLTVIANFTIHSDTVTFVAVNGTFTGAAKQIVTYGGSCTAVMAVPNTGYDFVGWSGGNTSTTNPLTITNVTSNLTITANFSFHSSTVTFIAGPNGTLTGTTTQTIPYGGNCTAVMAVPNAGYDFAGWSGGNTSTTNPVTITNVTSNIMITANFTAHIDTVTFIAGANGSLTGTVVQTVAYGGNCTAVTAVPNTGYDFANWSGGNTSTTNPLSISNVTSNITITANFTAHIDTITFVAGANGSLTGTVVQTVAYGGNCTAVTAVPNTGYDFANWSGGNTSMTNPLSISNVTSNMTITANFTIHNYTITFVAGSNGTLTGSATQTVAYGGYCTAVTAKPNTEYDFAGWTGSYTGTTNPLIITNVSSNMTITANFTKHNYTVTFIAGANGSLTGTTTQTIPYGGNCTAVTAVPNTGYDFSGWTGGYTGATNPIMISNVTSNLTVIANFTIHSDTVTFVAVNGTVTGVAKQIVIYGSSCTAVTAVPNTGYDFTGWSGGYTGTSNPLTITNVTSNLTITANFTIHYYTITFSADPNGSLAGTTTQIIAYGGNCTPVTAIPMGGHDFAGWTGVAGGYSYSNPLTITNVTSDMTIMANFCLAGDCARWPPARIDVVLGRLAFFWGFSILVPQA